MNTFLCNVSLTLSCLSEKQYSERSIQRYTKIYESLNAYLEKEEVTYSPGIGLKLIGSGKDTPFGTKCKYEIASSIAKLNDVYEGGTIRSIHLSLRPVCMKIELYPQFKQTISDYLEHCQNEYSVAQQENIRRRCVVFLKRIQLRGRKSTEELIYDDILSYHESLSYMKDISRSVEESSVKGFLRYLTETGNASFGWHLYLDVLQSKRLVSLESFSDEERQIIESRRAESLDFSAEDFRAAAMELADMHRNAGYVDEVVASVRRTIWQHFLFLDLHGLGYDPVVANVWINSDAVRSTFHSSSWFAARRTLRLFEDYASDGEVTLTGRYIFKSRDIDLLPEWCKRPLKTFAEQRLKEKLDEDTVKNDIYSCLRLCKYLISRGLNSYEELTGTIVMEFNRQDCHLSSKGKNACNHRIRRFLKFLSREGHVSNPTLYQAVCAAGASSESIIVTLNKDEIKTLREYIQDAQTPMAIRDCAVILLGTEMGIRGCDIVSLKLTDIDWKNRSIRFRQDKTDTDARIPMLTAVGNAIFRYLKDARPRDSKSDCIFVDFDAPYGQLTRHICWRALKRALPERKVYGSGFHVTRKTFATHRLRNNVHPEMIADAMGQRDTASLTSYLSLDMERMSMCPLLLNELGIPMNGGGQA